MTPTYQLRLRGFTVVEMLVVLAIMAVLTLVSMPVADIIAQREREQQLRRALWTIRDAIDEYKKARELGAIAGDASQSPYPTSLQALTERYTDARVQHGGRTMRFLREVPRDPFADPGIPAAESWTLRSFQSDADKPVAGTDVYDVHSRHPGRALDGSLLRAW